MFYWINNVFETLFQGKTVYVALVPKIWGNEYGTDVETKHYIITADSKPKFALTPKENLELGLIKETQASHVRDFYYKYDNETKLHCVIKMYASEFPFQIWSVTMGVYHDKMVYVSKLYKSKKVTTNNGLQKLIEEAKCHL